MPHGFCTFAVWLVGTGTIPCPCGCWVLFPLMLLSGSSPSSISFPTCMKTWGGLLADLWSSLSQASSFMVVWLSNGSCLRTLTASSVWGVWWAPLALGPGHSPRQRVGHSQAHPIWVLSFKCHWLSSSDLQCLENHFFIHIYLFLGCFRPKGKSAPAGPSWNKSLNSVFFIYS